MAKKNPHAVALGRKGGKARLRTMSAEERSARARQAVAARWAKAAAASAKVRSKQAARKAAAKGKG